METTATTELRVGALRRRRRWACAPAVSALPVVSLALIQSAAGFVTCPTTRHSVRQHVLASRNTELGPGDSGSNGNAGNRKSILLTAASRLDASFAVGDDIRDAKKALKRALREANGATKCEPVVSAVEALAAVNPTKEPARAWSLLPGDWKSLGQDLPGVETTAQGLECTLGRLTFDIFEPVKMPIVITSIENEIGSLSGAGAGGQSAADGSGGEALYAVTSRFTALDGSGLRGRVVVSGPCSPDPKKPQRLRVTFNKGVIEPDDGQALDPWREVIGVADKSGTDSSGREEKNSGGDVVGKMKKKVIGLMLKLAFGFKAPAEELGERGELSYVMERSPEGWLDVLFIDDDMRVTRGNRGSIVVVARK